MLDTHVAWLANQGMNYLSTDENPERLGNQHPNIVPYQVMPTSDGYIVLSIGNDPTFERFCELVAKPNYLKMIVLKQMHQGYQIENMLLKY